MYEVFTKLLNMSLTASFLVLIIIILRFVLKRAPKKYLCILWALVALRLICPFSISSVFSAYNVLHQDVISSGQVEYFEYNEKTEKPQLTFEVPALVNDNYSPDSMSVGTKTSKVNMPTIVYIWIAGVVIMISYAVASYGHLSKKVKASIKQDGNIFVCDDVDSPFILGVIRPRIYLPSGISDVVRENVVAHEQAHMKRLDYIWKPLGYLLLSIYWFNPLIWVAYIFLCKDIEAACDEKVISQMDKEHIASYSEALLACALHKRMITACPIAFGETDVNGRIRNVLSYKKPAFWIICISVIACIVVAVCFLTNPKNNRETSVSVADITENENEVAKKQDDKEESLLAQYSYSALIHTIESAMYDSSLIEENIGYYMGSDAMELCSSEFFTHLYDGSDDVAYQNLGYLIIDIDGDGNDELLLGENDPNPDGEYDGFIYDLYTCQGDTIKHLFSGGPRDRLILTNNNEFINEWSASAEDNGVIYFQYRDGKMQEVEKLLENSVKTRPKFTPMGPTWQCVDDLNGDGRPDYIIYPFVDGYTDRIKLYLSGEGVVFEHKDDIATEIGDIVQPIDIDKDGAKEIILTIFPHVNSASLTEFAVLKKKGDSWIELQKVSEINPKDGYAFPIIITMGEGTPISMNIACEGIDYVLNEDISKHYEIVAGGDAYFDEDGSFAKDMLSGELYESGEEFAHTSAYGIWEIKIDAENGINYLVAKHGIESDAWGKNDVYGSLDVWFNYDLNGKIKIFKMKYYPLEAKYADEISTLDVPTEQLLKWDDFGFDCWPLADGLLRDEWSKETPFWQFSASKGTSVYAVKDGTAVGGYNYDDGNYVILSLNDTINTYVKYCHLDTQHFDEPRFITAGTEIGTVGATGKATGPFLKVEISTDHKRRKITDAENISKAFSFAGVSGKLTVDVTEEVITQPVVMDVLLKDSNGKTVWKTELGIPHAGWNAYYVYSYNDTDYLIEYYPSASQGQISYSFKMYEFDAKGNAKVVDERYAVASDEVTGFLEYTKQYMDEAQLFISTINGVITTGI